MARVPPRSRAASAGGTSVPTGANRMAASSGSGGAAAASARAGGAELQGQPLGLVGAGHDVDAGAPSECDLGREVGRAPEPVDAEPSPVGQVGLLQGAIADDAGAEQWGHLDVAETVGQRVGVGLVRPRRSGA